MVQSPTFRGIHLPKEFKSCTTPNRPKDLTILVATALQRYNAYSKGKIWVMDQNV